MVTDKNKEQFERFYIILARKQEDVGSRYWDDTLINQFYRLPIEMQIGIFLAYYDSLGVFIHVGRNIDKEDYKMAILLNSQFYEHILSGSKDGFKTLNEAFKEAFKKANNLINEL